MENKHPYKATFNIEDELTLSNLFKFICKCYNEKSEHVKSKLQIRSFVKVRHAYCYFAIRYTKKTLREIGDIICKDHATVLHSNKTIKNWMFSIPEYKFEIEKIDKKIKRNFNILK